MWINEGLCGNGNHMERSQRKNIPTLQLCEGPGAEGEVTSRVKALG